jgi:Holliday junction resolvase RusA-like endonuclease
MQEANFTVHYLIPPTGNHYKSACKYIGRDGNLHLGFKITPAALAYYDAVAIFAQGACVSPKTENERREVNYAITMDVYLGPRQRGDADNFLKCGVDGLVKAGVIHSDANVKVCKVTVHRENRDYPHTTYNVRQMTKEETDGAID